LRSLPHLNTHPHRPKRAPLNPLPPDNPHPPRSVYKARFNGSLVAVKVLEADAVTRRDPVTGVSMEAVLSVTLSHPNVVHTLQWRVMHGDVSFFWGGDAFWGGGGGGVNSGGGVMGRAQGFFG